MLLILPCGTCPNFHPFSDIAPYCRNTGTPSRTYILLAQGLQIGFISLVVAARIVGLKETMRPRGKECCNRSIMSAMDLGKRAASCLLCICQLGPNSTRQESNLIQLLKIFCICKWRWLWPVIMQALLLKLCVTQLQTSVGEELEDSDILWEDPGKVEICF